MEKEFRCYGTSKLVCPYCGYEHEEMDLELEEDYADHEEIECHYCDKRFCFEYSRSIEFISEKIKRYRGSYGNKIRRRISN